VIARLALAAVAIVAALAPARAVERIERFVSEVDVQRNGDLLVTESIQIWAEGRQIKRGILRDFPTTYRRADGSRVEVGFDVQAVMRDGAPEAFATEKMANGVRVRIGSAGRDINRGSHLYIIRYRTTRQIGFFKNFDELYWNATGTGWTFPIDVAEARINLPERVGFGQSAFYTGPQGARGKDAMVVEHQPGRIVFRTTRPLPVANGLTVAAAWPKGVVAEPTTTQRLGAMLKDDPALLTAAVGGGAVIAFYLLAWFLIGRDPPRGTVIPLFAPPKGMSAATVRFVYEMGFDDRVFSAAIVGLGVNGHLKLIDRAGEQELRHVRGNRPLDPAEQALETVLFANKSTVSLDNSEHELIGEARHALHLALQRICFGTLFRNHVWWSSFGLVAAVLVTSAIALAYAGSYGQNTPGILAGLFVPLIPVMAGVGIMRRGWRRGSRGMLGVYFGLAVVAAAVVIGIVILSYNIGLGPAILPALVPSVLAGFVARGFSWLKAPTEEGRRVTDQIEGFKEYLSVAEEDRLEYLNPPEKTPELFERFLPYAIALDVENSWAKRFTGVLAAAGVGAAVASWYSGDSHSTSDIVSFTDRLGDNLSNTISAAATPPGSSGGSDGGGGGGSSGGGSSGGGGGGGGGSGW
jgi:uncharacterized membrane protein YgcG